MGNQSVRITQETAQARRDTCLRDLRDVVQGYRTGRHKAGLMLVVTSNLLAAVAEYDRMFPDTWQPPYDYREVRAQAAREIGLSWEALQSTPEERIAELQAHAARELAARTQ